MPYPQATETTEVVKLYLPHIPDGHRSALLCDRDRFNQADFASQPVVWGISLYCLEQTGLDVH